MSSHYNTNPAGVAATQVGDGPRVGNKSLGAKRAEFIASKAEFKAMADSITDRYAQRGNVQRATVDKNDSSIKPNTKAPRGPTRGNK